MAGLTLFEQMRQAWGHNVPQDGNSFTRFDVLRKQIGAPSSISAPVIKKALKR